MCFLSLPDSNWWIIGAAKLTTLLKAGSISKNSYKFLFSSPSGNRPSCHAGWRSWTSSWGSCARKFGSLRGTLDSHWGSSAITTNVEQLLWDLSVPVPWHPACWLWLEKKALSMDSRRGSELYKFDMSLMERLSSSGFPMSQIDVQRRMRPEISNLIRWAAVRTCQLYTSFL